VSVFSIRHGFRGFNLSKERQTHKRHLNGVYTDKRSFEPESIETVTLIASAAINQGWKRAPYIEAHRLKLPLIRERYAGCSKRYGQPTVSKGHRAVKPG
jgi:hypothetical protein